MEVKITDKGLLETLEANFYEYKAKQDIINSVFDTHAYDLDASVISSIPFKAYEKQFQESKIKYETIRDIVQDTYVPKEMQEAGCRWEVNFNTETIVITQL